MVAITVADSAKIGVIYFVMTNQSNGFGSLGTTIVEPGSIEFESAPDKNILLFLISLDSPFGKRRNKPSLSAESKKPPAFII